MFRIYDPNDANSVSTDLVERGVQSYKRWAYCTMIDYGGEVLEHLSHLSETCPCHRKKTLVIEGASRHKRNAFYNRLLATDSCPLRTLLAPEFAAGELQTLLTQLLMRTAAKLMHHKNLIRCTGPDRAAVLKEWGRMKRHIAYSWNLKLSFYRTLPWLLLALGHSDQRVARDSMRLAVQLYEVSDPSTQPYYAHLLLGFGAQGRDQTLLFIVGHDIEDVPILFRFGQRARFVPVSERWIEAQHATAHAHQRASRNTSIVHIAWTGDMFLHPVDLAT